MGRTGRRLAIGAGITVACLTGIAAAAIGLYVYITRPVTDGARLGEGSVVAVVSGHQGPVAIVAYLVALENGDVMLVDSGMDPNAARIVAALQGLGKTRESVRAILLTHGHDDHAGGVAAFPNATVYGLASDIDAVRRRRARAGSQGETLTVAANERLDLSGTQVAVFGLPGHTKGSAAYLVDGVLFLGDSAQSMRDGRFGPNTVLSEDADSTVRSVAGLAETLQRGEHTVRHVAFGHSGPLDGLDGLLAWAATR